MLLSIITVNYNNKQGLKKTIESVIIQSCNRFEWIIIDGNSKDGSRELIENYSEFFSYWVSEPDNGVYDAMNKGIEVAKGDYILFLNSGDTLLDKQVVESIYIEELKKDIIVYDIYLEKSGHLIKKDLSNLTNLSMVSYLFHSTFPHQSTLIKRELFNKFGLYNIDNRYISDWIFFYKSCILSNASFLYQKGHAISVYDMTGISTVNKKETKRERERFLREIYSPRMYDYIKSNYLKEKKYINLQHPAYKFIIRGLLWISNKLS